MTATTQVLTVSPEWTRLVCEMTEAWEQSHTMAAAACAALVDGDVEVATGLAIASQRRLAESVRLSHEADQASARST